MAAGVYSVRIKIKNVYAGYFAFRPSLIYLTSSSNFFWHLNRRKAPPYYEHTTEGKGANSGPMPISRITENPSLPRLLP